MSDVFEIDVVKQVKPHDGRAVVVVVVVVAEKILEVHLTIGHR
jgi:hypothetical protein